MFAFSPAEQASLRDELRLDGQGRQVLVSLTFEETAEFWTLVRLSAAGERIDEDQKHRYMALSQKLDRALAVNGATGSNDATASGLDTTVFDSRA